MPIEHRCIGGTDIAILTGDEKQIIDVQSALDLAISLKHEAGIDRIAIDKHVVADEFFILSSGMAGEIIQKFVNYHVIAAIYGDFSRYTSKPLRDFIRESNRGSCFFFLSTQEEASAPSFLPDQVSRHPPGTRQPLLIRPSAGYS